MKRGRSVLLAAVLALASSSGPAADEPGIVLIGNQAGAPCVLVLSAEGKLLSKPQISKEELAGATSLEGGTLVNQYWTDDGGMLVEFRDPLREDWHLLGSYRKFSTARIAPGAKRAALISAWKEPMIAVAPLDKGGPQMVWKGEGDKRTPGEVAWCGAETLLFTVVRPGAFKEGSMFVWTKDAPVAVQGESLASWLVSDPAGKRVAFLHREDTALEIRILEVATLETETVRRLPLESPIHDLGWISDGSRLYLSFGGGLLLLATDGAETVLAEAKDGPYGGISWAPDGSRFWMSSPGKMDEILGWIVAADGSKKQPLGVVGIAGDVRPEFRGAFWSPDGSLIAFTRDYPTKEEYSMTRRGGSEPFTIAADDTGEKKLREGDARLLGWLDRN